MHVPMSDFSRGPADQTSLQAGKWRVGVSICYEIAFGEEVIHALPDAALLVNVSNNAWFGDSSAPHQVLEMGQMRALETQRWLLSATNDGMTAIVDAGGRIVAEAPRYQRTVLTGKVEPRKGATPYVRWGNVPVVAGLLIGLVWLVVRRRV
jgi:apolipoprotein N-acyltransferase